MIWHCEDCHITVDSDPVAHDDWGDQEVAIGPCCQHCEMEMEYVDGD